MQNEFYLSKEDVLKIVSDNLFIVEVDIRDGQSGFTHCELVISHSEKEAEDTVVEKYNDLDISTVCTKKAINLINQ